MDREPRSERPCLGVGITLVLIALGGALVALLISLASAERNTLVYWLGKVGLLLLLSVIVGGVAVTTLRALVGLVRTLRGDGDAKA
jgi:hypothetical protein